MRNRKGAEKAETQTFGSVAAVRIGLSAEVRSRSIRALNRMLAHTLALRDLYRKNHWQTSGVTFYQLHLLFEKHSLEQDQLSDAIAERVQTLGGVAIALPEDISRETSISRVPRGRQAPAVELAGLLNAHEALLSEVRVLAREAGRRGDDGTNDLFVSQIVRTNERHSWFVAEHLALRNVSGRL